MLTVKGCCRGAERVSGGRVFAGNFPRQGTAPRQAATGAVSTTDKAGGGKPGQALRGRPQGFGRAGCLPASGLPRRSRGREFYGAAGSRREGAAVFQASPRRVGEALETRTRCSRDAEASGAFVPCWRSCEGPGLALAAAWASDALPVSGAGWLAGGRRRRGWLLRVPRWGRA